MAPVFRICSADPQVRAHLLGSDGIVRLFEAEAEQGTAYPYAVWQQITGQPHNYLADRPNMDGVFIQVDVYAKSAGQVSEVASALRGAIEPHAYITRLGGTSRDPETGSYRYSFDVDWRVER